MFQNVLTYDQSIGE